MTREERTAHWSAIIERQAASGMSGLSWCKEHHVNPAGFYSWRRKLNAPERAEGFIELNAVGGTGIHIHIGTTLSIEVERGFDPSTLCAVIATLRNVPCSV